MNENMNNGIEENEDGEEKAVKGKLVIFHTDPVVPGVTRLTARTTKKEAGETVTYQATVNFPNVLRRKDTRASMNWEQLHAKMLELYGVEVLCKAAEKAIVIDAQDSIRRCMNADSLPELQALGTNYTPFTRSEKANPENAAKSLVENIQEVSSESANALVRAIFRKNLEEGKMDQGMYEQACRSLGIEP